MSLECQPFVVFDAEDEAFPIADVRVGDLIFIGGNPPNSRSEFLFPLEHVAVVAEIDDKLDNTDRIKVYGLPESIREKSGLRITSIVETFTERVASRTHTSPDEFEKIGLGKIGHPKLIWNFAVRIFEKEDDGEEFVKQFEFLTGQFGYDMPTRLREEYLDPYTNNCLGFVTTALSQFLGGLQVFDGSPMRRFVSYRSPYFDKVRRETGTPETYNFPTVGHLPFALLEKSNSLPYAPRDQNEAERNSTVARSIEIHRAALYR